MTALPAISDPWVKPIDEAGGDEPCHAMILLVPSMSCAGCMAKVEKNLESQPDVISARVNFSTKRVRVEWKGDAAFSRALIDGLTDAGYEAVPVIADETGQDLDKAELSALVRALAVAGFAAGNIMLLSVSVWSGATDATRDLFHWISALIAIPAVAYAGQPFFRSAVSALSARRLNMDVPISLAVILALALSLHETAIGASHAWFDASVMLLFFLLIGRTLDRMMRARARSAASSLLTLKPDVATLVETDGRTRIVASRDLKPGMVLKVSAGERIAADGRIVSGMTTIDNALLTGESLPEAAGPESHVHAGTMNLGAPFEMIVDAAGEGTLVAEIAGIMEAAEGGKARVMRLADKAARIYAPAVHLAAFVTFLVWLSLTGDWHSAALPAIAVLIITCPCALGLAVPAVQVVASNLLFRRGILLKDGGALERLAEVDTAVFDKTGTLTSGRPRLLNGHTKDEALLAFAAGLADASNHPLCRSLASAVKTRGVVPATVDDITETPGAGLEGMIDGKPVRLGSRTWCDNAIDIAEDDRAPTMEVWLTTENRSPVQFRFVDELRPEASQTLTALAERGIPSEILSGDREANVRAIAAELNLSAWRGGLSPAGKLNHIDNLADQGSKVLVVGDGLNDGPALAAGHVSMAPSSASDLGQTAADLVFLGRSLAPVADAHDIAVKARRIIWQNFAFAAAYNCLAVPIAAAGLATPLVAAIAMSSSSLIVIANALRLRLIISNRSTRGEAELPAPLATRAADPEGAAA